MFSKLKAIFKWVFGIGIILFTIYMLIDIVLYYIGIPIR